LDNARGFINQELKPLWPKWNPTENELRIWAQILEDYTYDQAVQKAEEYYKAGGSSKAKPHVSGFRKSGGTSKTKEIWETKTDIYVECTKHEEKPWLVGRSEGVFTPAHYDREEQLQAAESERERKELYEGGSWIVRRKLLNAN